MSFKTFVRLYFDGAYDTLYEPLLYRTIKISVKISYYILHISIILHQHDMTFLNGLTNRLHFLD